MHHVIEDVFATRDQVAVRFVIRGTHTGDFFGLPPTGRPVTVAANVLMHVSNRVVTKLAGVFDEAGMLRQLGVLPG
jgi:predicted ester cyclase